MFWRFLNPDKISYRYWKTGLRFTKFFMLKNEHAQDYEISYDYVF